MDYLLFRLYAPLASFGEVAVGEFRGSHLYPARSAVLGLLAAALGIERDDEARQSELRNGYQVAVAMLSSGALLRDYHTAQVPSTSALKKRPHQTRADELALAKDDLNTILSTRDYRQDAASIVAVAAKSGASLPWALTELAEHLKKPVFVLYLGRKCCPPALPLQPQVVAAESLFEAFSKAQFGPMDRVATTIQRVAWEDSMVGGFEATAHQRMEVLRKDQPLSRRRWQFTDRTEHIAVLSPEAIEGVEDAEEGTT